MAFQNVPEDIGDHIAYDPESGLLTWKKGTSRFSRVTVGARAGTVVTNGYIIIRFRGLCLPAHRVAFVIAYGRQPIGQIDHRDLNRTNNRLSNLREATCSENAANRPGWGRYPKGVRKSGQKFYAAITWHGEHIYLGTSETVDEAATAYRAAANKIHGEFARVA